MSADNIVLLGRNGKRDETGLISYEVPVLARSEAEVLQVGPSRPFGLDEVDRTFKRIDGTDFFEVKVSYEGLPEGVDEGDEEIDFDPSFSEEPIASHPKWLDLKKRYGGEIEDNGKVKWPETIETSTYNGLAAASTKEVKNPMLGVETYLALKVTFRRTYSVRKLPTDLLDGIGEIVEKLPDGFPTPEGRNWLKLPPKVSQRGNSYKISEELLLSPVGGTWPRGVYGLIET